eukprot:SM000024S07813  [mRNA]  locus=s24:674512:677233:- [translate_table: standard]
MLGASWSVAGMQAPRPCPPGSQPTAAAQPVTSMDGQSLSCRGSRCSGRAKAAGGPRPGQYLVSQRALVALAALLCCVAGVAGQAKGASIGVNWGRVSNQPLPPKMVVQMLVDNNIKKVKLFDADEATLRAMAGYNIEVMVTVRNEELATMATNQQAAQDWVDHNVMRYIFPGGVSIKYVAVGNEVFLSDYAMQFLNILYPAMLNIYSALRKRKLDGSVKVTTPLNADVLGESYPPSVGIFRSDVAPIMQQVVTFMSQTKAPFVINIYPYLVLTLNSNSTTDPNFIFFGRNGTGSFVDPGTGLTYGNVFDATYDATLAAMAKVGVTDVEVIVGEFGWPTDGEAHANMASAQEFNQGAIQHFLSGAGTPALPGQVINGYLFSIIDENAKSVAPGPFERHWGIFNYDGTAKYSLDLAGTGNPNATMVSAKGVLYLARRWCIADASNGSTNTVDNSLSFICSNTVAGDCTPTLEGGSCYLPNSLAAHASYGYNSYYQALGQKDTACEFNGTGHIVDVDPSHMGCNFTIALDEAMLNPSSSALSNQPCNGWLLIASTLVTIALVLAPPHIDL